MKSFRTVISAVKTLCSNTHLQTYSYSLTYETTPHPALLCLCDLRGYSLAAVQLTNVVLPVFTVGNAFSPDEHFIGLRVQFEVFG